MSNVKVVKSFPILGILGLIFVTLKLAEIGAVATWSWWWVLLPFYGPLALVLSLALGSMVVFCIGWLVLEVLKLFKTK
tara:strand:- start:63303 stop:63536 length:234 start_codon:yes stop_codon:yes gene_type:complete